MRIKEKNLKKLIVLLLCAGLFAIFLYATLKPIVIEAQAYTLSQVSEEESVESIQSWSIVASAASSLKDSEWDGEWYSDYANYNCYAYAIGVTEWHNPGDFSDNKDAFSRTNIAGLAYAVKYDLEGLGFEEIYVGNSKPAIRSYEKLICVRRGTDDYHFMRYDASENVWYHKPSTTAVLKYKYEPSFSREWTNEYIDRNGVAHEGGHTYDSQIYYIAYSQLITEDLSLTTVKITGVNGMLTGEMEIPSALGGKTVTQIGDSAFAGQTGLTNVTIPDTITNIGNNAFYGCSDLTSITIPNSI